ncbi:MAG: MarR family transcriptional regulator [Chitinophagales bacterium]|nr:MarR family transcriptional regulator [Chitinophagales bacterium]
MNDFLKEIEHLGITARIKRLNDSLTYGIKALYQSQDMDIEPSWHLILLLLKKEQQLSLVELSERLHISQPAITKAIKKMKAKAYVQQKVSPSDNRVKLIELTEKSQQAFPAWERVWDAGQKAIAELLENNEHFFSALAAFEHANKQQAFKERASNLLKD